MSSPPPPPARLRSPLVEVAVAALVVVGFALLGHLTGWKGPPRTAISTYVWPFYIDTWFTHSVWTGRVLLSASALLLAALVVRRFAEERDDDDSTTLALLVGLFAAAWLFHLACGVQRFGVQGGLTKTFARVYQEYWSDVRYVGAGFLARFPDGLGRLSQHGAVHPPGAILFLAGLKELGFKEAIDAELACSFAGALSVFPLWGATRRLVDRHAARVAAPLFLFACSVVAYSVLAMDAVTMLFSALALYGLARALGGELLGGLLWGASFAVASLFTFTALTLALTYGIWLLPRLRRLDRARWQALLLGPLAFVTLYLGLWLGLGYRPFHTFFHCLAEFDRSDDIHRVLWRGLLGNPVAFLGMLGLPLAGLVGHAVASAIRRLRRRESVDDALLVLGALAPPLLCILLGKPRAEVEHIFLLFIPGTILAAAMAARRWYDRGPSWLRLVVATLGVQSILIEVYLDTLW